MIQHCALELKLSKNQTRDLTDGYRKVVEHLESRFPLDTRVLDELKEAPQVGLSPKWTLASPLFRSTISSS